MCCSRHGISGQDFALLTRKANSMATADSHDAPWLSLFSQFLGSQECALTLSQSPWSVGACHSLLLSKLLGYFLVLLSVTALLPQIQRILRAKSAQGLSFTSFCMDFGATLICLIYAIRNNWSLSTYGESWFFIIQEFVILTLIILLPNPKFIHLFAFGTMVGIATVILFNPVLVPMTTLTVLNTAAIPFFIASKIPQILENYKNGGTGELSLWTIGNSLFGTASRAYTTFIELGDAIVLGGYMLSTLLNAIIFTQILYYSAQKDKKKQK